MTTPGQINLGPFLPVLRLPLRTPTRFTATLEPTTPPSITLAWTGGLGSVRIDRAIGRFTRTFTRLSSANGIIGTYHDTNLTTGQHYYYRLQGYIGGQNAPFSNVLDVRTPGLAAGYVTPTSQLEEVPPQRYWQFASLDGREVYTFARNPNTAGNPYEERTVNWDRTPAGTYSGTRAGRAPVRWEISGRLHDRSQHHALLHWLNRGEKIHLTTDLGEVHVARIISYNPSQKGGQNPDYAQWSMTLLLYDGIILTEPLTSSVFVSAVPATGQLSAPAGGVVVPTPGGTGSTVVLSLDAPAGSV